MPSTSPNHRSDAALAPAARTESQRTAEVTSHSVSKRFTSRTTAILVAACLQSLGLIGIASAAPGDLDPSFGDGGITTTEIPGNAYALARQPDGKIIVVGYGVGGVWAVARYTDSGQLDPTFSGDGWTTVDFGAGLDYATAVAIQSDGKIVVGGIAKNPSWSDFALVRFHADGSLDETFSEDGKVVTPLSADDRENDELSSILIQPDGNILALGTTPYNNSSMVAVRYLPTGVLDTSFRGSGISKVVFNLFNKCSAAALQSDGAILLAGSVGTGAGTRRQLGLCRMLPTGNLDTSFSGDGWVVWDSATGDTEENIESLAIQADGSIVASGTAGSPVVNGTDNSNDDYAIMRVTTTGDFDTSFSGDGKLLIPIESAAGNPQGGNQFGPSCLIRPDAKILLGGWYPGPPGSSLPALCRLSSSGVLDPTFSGDGFAVAPPELEVDSIMAMTPQPDGKVVAVLLDGNFRLARFIVDEDTDGDGADNPTEAASGTNPGDRDTDDDGVEDGPEIARYGTNPLIPDTDGDGLSDGAEVNLHKSNPLLDDSDGDGLEDYEEVTTHGTNPSRADTDGDGLSDRVEIQTHFTLPKNPDTDGDGLSDGAEVDIHLTNPKAADTDGDGFQDGYEVQTGKSPKNAADKPALVAEARTAIEFTFPSAIGKTYRIEVSTDLESWQTVESGIIGSGGEVQRFYSIRGLPKRYFRVEEEAP